MYFLNVQICESNVGVVVYACIHIIICNINLMYLLDYFNVVLKVVITDET